MRSEDSRPKAHKPPWCQQGTGVLLENETAQKLSNQYDFCTPYHPLILTKSNRDHLLTQMSQGGSQRSYEVNNRGQEKRSDIGCEKVEEEAELWEQIQNFRNPDVAKCE